METPRIFLAYTPRGAGLRAAVAYLPRGRDVYGWYTGPRADATAASAYFLLEDLYTEGQARHASSDDLYDGWLRDDALCHDLARLQEAFRREWLLYRGDPGAAAALDAYAREELASGEVNVRHERLTQFSKLQPTWTFYSPGFERTVLRHLAKRWPLEYRVED
jgi:hypothetical protein